MDTGLCHKKGNPHSFMYRAEDISSYGPDVDLMATPVRVWDASGGAIAEVTLSEFNASYVVDFRFDTSRLPKEIQP